MVYVDKGSESLSDILQVVKGLRQERVMKVGG